MAESKGSRPAHNFKDLTGQRFGRWTVISRAQSTPAGGARWLCRCECGTDRIISSGCLRNGHTKSCGCLNSEITSARNRTHGLSKDSAYQSWGSMIKRCLNPNCKAFGDYGGRGITVCERWLKFENFYADMGPRPSDKHELDRFPNNDGNYEPGNCRWATVAEQARNRRSNRLLTFRGETLTLTEWSERTGIDRGAITARLKRGWSIERTLTLADGQPHSLLSHNGETLHMAEWSRRTGLSVTAIRLRLKRGWTIADALTRPLRITSR